ncbi:MAG: glutamine--fructose-6-phosphate transaminase (isomerizing) [Candidatus Micrarchaeia archaeon]
MCGIVGYIGGERAAPLILKSLKNLDYRGYDSAGIATLDGKGIHARKDKGKIEEIERKMDFTALPGSIGIGHTRWATHGIPSRRNAHPHFDCRGSVCLVHNGVIENYAELRESLKQKGHRFSSDTDSEVVAHLVEEKLKAARNAGEAVKQAVAELKGAWALAVLVKGEERIFLARSQSPLVIGVGNGEMWCASDVPALLAHTKKFVFLEDGEFAVLSRCGYEAEREGRRTARKPVEVAWTTEMAQRGGYPHFMLKEIEEQPQSVAQTLALDVGEAAEFARKFKRIHVVAAGTSYHAGLVFKYLAARLGLQPADAFIASEYAQAFAGGAGGETLVLAISQSGETADTLAAVREAKKRGARTLAITNVVGSSLAREADVVLCMQAGPEISVVATKTFLAQLAVLCALAARMAGDEKLRKELERVPELVRDVLKKRGEIERVAERISRKRDFFFIGRGLGYPIALEGALKLKEITYTHAEAYPGGELKHGPLSLLEKGVPVIAIAPSDATLPKMLGNIQECRAREAQLIVLSDSSQALAAADERIRMPKASPLLAPFLYIVPLQLLAYHAAVLRGADPDKPRNLAKSVTVE